MDSFRFWRTAAIIVAATIGEGVFALPYIFQQAGWLVGICYLAVLATVVIVAQLLYLKTIQHVGEKERLLGLVRKYFGETGFWIGFLAIIAGLLLTLVAYLILGPRFIVLAFPSLSPGLAFALFWIAISIPVLVSNLRAVKLEVVGVALVAATIIFVFVNGLGGFRISVLPVVASGNIFLPFGIILLSLAGWTGIEPLYESAKKSRMMRRAPLAVIFGTVLAAVLYLLFIVGITGGAAHITSDTLSGIANWAEWKRFLVAALGLFAVGTGSVPLTHEIRNALENDLGWNEYLSRGVIILAPVALVLAGFNNFIVVLGLAGGCFIALQYLLIVVVGRRTLRLSFAQKIALDVVALVFIIAAVYEVSTFIVK